MKKLISLALAIVMIMCLSTTAFAETVNNTGDYTADVTGSYVAGNESNGIVYCVDITWSDLDFTYHAEKGAIWDPETLKYSEVEPAYWEGKGTITVTNRSNTKITAVPGYAPAAGYGDAGMDFDTDKLKVASAESGTAQTGIITVTPNGFLPAMDEADIIGTITLTIDQDADVTDAEARALLTAITDLIDDWKTAGGSDEETSSLRTKQTTLEGVLYGGMSQDSLNSAYKDALDAYNALKAKYDAL